MPCYRDDEADRKIDEEKRKFLETEKIEACLCSALKYMQSRATLSEFYDFIEEGECNFDAAPFLRKWFKNHLENDEIKKTNALKAEMREKLKKEALDKLSDLEKRLLGLIK